MSGKGAGVMANRVLQIVVAGVMLGAFFTLGWGQENVEYNFGVVPFFKNYPEYKRGYDPWSNLSGTVQENVDLYGGKLTLTVPLPGIPWSETTAFAPVLLYNSNIWSYRAPTYKMSLGGELSMGKDGDDYTPAERVMPTYKIADYWCNDAWMRFSPIGRTHNLPGWTLPVGGVYTEYVQSSQSIGLEGVDYFAQTPNPDIIDNRCYRATVEKKYFVAPDGSSHLLVDLETHCRPYFSSIGIPNEVVCELNCYLPGGELQSICLPDRECDTPIWYAVDGSGYYYLADQGKVYDKNGTTYSLDDDGMVSAITDRDGNTIHVQLSDTGNEKILKYTGPTGATLKIGFQKKTLVNGTGPAEYIDVLILKWLELPGLGGGGVVRYEFLTAPLIQHLQQCNVIPDGQTELRFEDIFHDAYLWCEMDGMEQGLQMDFSQAVFAALGEPSAGEHNAQIDVLTGMILPDGRSVQFEYNIAGKLSRIVYPDKGYRRYEYGNTLDISTAQSNCIRPAWGWHGKLAGQSPLGGVSLVWLDDGSGTQLERAYAYSGYNYPGGVADPEDGAAYIQTLVWMGDRSVQMYSYFPSDDDEVVGQNILQFGFTHWKVGKLVKTRQYSFSSWTGQEPQFEKYFLRIDDLGVPSQYPFNDVRNAIGAAVNKLAETESVYLNWDPGWQWEPPSAMCCASSFTPPSFYREVIPQAPTYTWNTFPFSEFQFPEWNTVVTQKIERQYEGTSLAVERRTVYQYAHVNLNGFTEKYGQLNAQEEWDGQNNRLRRTEYTWRHYWPAQPVTGLPARVLGLPETTRVLDASGQVISETWNHYPDVNGRQDFRPDWTKSLIEAGRWAVTQFEYENIGTDQAVRLTRVKQENSGTVRNTVRFDYDPASGLLRNLLAYTGDESVLKLYMCLDHDPFTGLLRRRMDRNGDRNGDLQFDDAGDDYIRFVYDGFNRLSGVERWHGGKAEVLSAYQYPDTTPFVVQRCDYLDEQTRRWTRVRNDALGRAAETWTTLTGDQAAYSVKTFDVLGRVVTESNPVAVTVDPDAGTWSADGSACVTTSAYDALGRVVARTAPGGFTVSTAFGLGTARDIVTGAATIPATTERVTEQVGDEARWRQLYRDAFGRIVQVDECLPDGGAGEWRTLYGYDAADRLRQVDKRAADGASGQRRVFDYNAAGWLTAVQLPEYADQKMRYAYDDLGNVTAKTLVSAMYGSPLGYAETLAYDALSRLTARTVTFSDHLVHHTFTYDGGAVAAPPAGHPGDFAWGRLTHDRTTYGLDPGAVAVERFVRYNWQGLPEEKAERFGTLVDEDTVAGEEFVTAYPAYDRQGNLRAMTYPSGQAVAWEYQDGGTLREVGDGTRAIFSNLAYAAHGAVAGMQLGDAATGQAGWGQAFDPARLWPVRIVAGTTSVTGNTTTASGAVLFGLDYDNYEANGNIAAVTRTLRTGAYGTPYTMDFGYSYDRLNRLAGCAVADAVYTYAMDEFGNITARTRAAGGGNDLPSSLALVVSRATNRLGGAGYYHDVLGNLVEMPGGANGVFMTYLDQGHIGTLTDASGVVWKYYYDADGKRRIKVKTAGGAATEPDGQGGVRLVADRSYYFYEGEDLICQQDIGTLVQDESQYEPKFLLLDHLGSTRAELVFDPSTLAPQIQEYYDLMPYGEVIDPPTSQESVLFTGKPRDIESGLDIFPFRPYSNQLCRWIAADQPFADNTVGDPQSWNMYSYVRSNPIVNYDPDGRALDTIVDVGFIVYDVGDIVVTTVSGDSVTGTQWAALGADALGALIPFATGGGLAVRASAKAAAHLDDAARAANALDKTLDVERSLEKGTRAVSAAEKATQGGRAFKELVSDFSANPENWKLVSAHAEEATRKGARSGGVSTQKIYVNKQTGERLVEHTVTNNKGKVVDQHFRPDYKPRKGEVDPVKKPNEKKQ